MVVQLKRKLRKTFHQLLWAVLSPLLRQASNPERVTLTCTRGDGGGAQWHGRFSVMAFADRHNMNYLPSKFDRVMPINTEEIRKLWTDLFVGEFSQTEIPDNRVKADSINLFTKAVLASFFKGESVLIDVGHLHSYTDLHTDAIVETIRLHKIRYNNPAEIEIHGPHSPQIVMHVRRGLSWETKFTSNRLTSDDQVLRRLNDVRHLTGISHGTVFSAVPNENLSSKLPRGFGYDHHSDEFTLIHRMINADAVILAKSCLSYVAGAFSRGEVFYDPFFHPPLPDWMVLGSSFDS